MADPLYTHEKLGSAVNTLATGRGRIKERLNDAVSDLVMVDADVFELPEIDRDARSFWSKIWGALNTVQIADPKVGTAAASIDRMSEEDAANVAQQIVSLDAMLGSYLDHERSRNR